MMIESERLEEAVAACYRAREADAGFYVRIQLGQGFFHISGSRIIGAHAATTSRKVTFADVAACRINSLLEAVNAVVADLASAKVPGPL